MEHLVRVKFERPEASLEKLGARFVGAGIFAGHAQRQAQSGVADRGVQVGPVDGGDDAHRDRTCGEELGGSRPYSGRLPVGELSGGQFDRIEAGVDAGEDGGQGLDLEVPLGAEGNTV